MFYAKFPIDGIRKIYEHSLAHPVFTPTFPQLFEGRFRKDGKDVPLDGKHSPRANEVDASKLPPQFFVVKDRGAYAMAATEATLPGEDTPNFVVYAEGFNPNVDEDYWDAQQAVWGGDDFSEGLPLEWLKLAIENAERLKIDHMVIKVNKNSLELVTGKKL